jgi:hypothetical protein
MSQRVEANFVRPTSILGKGELIGLNEEIWFFHILRSLRRSAHCQIIGGTEPIHVKWCLQNPKFWFGPNQNSSGTGEVG